MPRHTQIYLFLSQLRLEGRRYSQQWQVQQQRRERVKFSASYFLSEGTYPVPPPDSGGIRSKILKDQT